MKNDLATSILAAIVGVAISYFVVNLFFGEIEDVTISSVDPNLTVELAEPNADIFNFLSVNPTVEVYVGECDEYDETTGECLEKDNPEPSDNASENEGQEDF